VNDSSDSAHQPTVLQMAAPLVVSFWMRAAFTFVDTIYAATIGDAAVAALGLTVPFEFLTIAVWVGLSTGLTSALARAMGARQGRKIEQYLKASRRLVLIVAPSFMALGAVIWFAAPRAGLDEAVYRSFRIYGTTLIGGGALTFFWSIIPDSLVKAHQDTRTTMWAGIASNVLNVILNTVFVFVFHWGVFGIALSTVIGRIGGLFYAQAKARQHERRRLATVRREDTTRDPTPYRAVLSLAIPSSITFALMALETAIINGLLAADDHATEAIAAYSIFHRVVLFGLNPIIAASVALLPYSARRFGESDIAGIRRALRQTYVASIAYALLVATPFMLVAAAPIARWLAESALTTRYATVLLWAAPAACLMGAPFLLCRPVFEGMQRGRPGLVMALLRYLLLTPPAAWLGMQGAIALGYPGLYGLVAAALAVAAITSLAFHLWLRAALANP
jgi:Na+-driven multidrug efflux pump